MATEPNNAADVGDSSTSLRSGASLTARRPRVPQIGGPGTLLPAPVECLLSWSLCASCLAVSGYHYVKSTYLSPALSYGRLVWRRTVSAAGRCSAGTVGDDLPYSKCWIPLTTHSRAELDRASPRERHGQLVEALRTLTGVDDCDRDVPDDVLVRTLRSDRVCRRLASLAMRPYGVGDAARSGAAGTTNLLGQAPELKLVRRLARLWPALLVLPPANDDAAVAPQQRAVGAKYEVSLVLPAFREDGSEVNRRLDRAREACVDPTRVEVVLVDAGGCRNLDSVAESHMSQERGSGGATAWGRFDRVEFGSGGGRGPCLNFGAGAASGRILTFCHSDTQLPDRWDESIVKAFTAERGTSSDGHGKGGAVRISSCAFSFGIDATPAGLNGGPYPPGIRAVETTANLRTHLFSLPYGDQCLSVPRDVFHFLGGFPDQCLMEDYELVALLRKRAAHMPKFDVGGDPSIVDDDGGGGTICREKLAIIGGKPSLCSPRRWQKLGVLRVTFTNSKLVNLYAGGMGPDELFRLYYGAEPPERECKLSPWEVEMDDLLRR